MKSNREQLKIAEKYINESCPRCCHMGSNCCCYFVSKIFSEAGNASLFYGGYTVTYCPNAIKWCKANLAEIPIYLAMPSDVIFFDWELNGTPNHIGFVNHRISDQVVATLEGNTTAKGIVAYRERPVKYIQGVYRPHFKPSSFKIGKLKIDGEFDYSSVAMLQTVLKRKADGILKRSDIISLQKYVGVPADGRWGQATSKAIQKKLCGFKGDDVDGWFGVESTKALQKWINSKYQPGKKEEPKAYNGKYPSLEVTETKTIDNTKKILATAKELCWAKGTKKAKYAYKGGAPLKAFTKALHEVYTAKERSHWGVPPQKGASCDVVVGTIVRASGVDKNFPRGLSEQSPYTSKEFTKIVKKGGNPYDMSQTGDIVWYDYKGAGAHVCIRGEDVIYQGGYASTYAHTDIGVKKQLDKKEEKVIIFRAKPTQFKTARHHLERGDEGTAVLRLQKYINWYFGKDVLKEDGIFGDETEKYTKKMQNELGVESDGKVSESTLAKMKAVRK